MQYVHSLYMTLAICKSCKNLAESCTGARPCKILVGFKNCKCHVQELCGTVLARILHKYGHLTWTFLARCFARHFSWVSHSLPESMPRSMHSKPPISKFVLQKFQLFVYIYSVGNGALLLISTLIKMFTSSYCQGIINEIRNF